MKKFKFLVLSLMMCLISLLAGCSSNTTSSATKTNDANEIADNNSTANDTVTETPDQGNEQKVQNENISVESIASLKETIDNVIAKVDKATPYENSEKRKNQFFELKKELNAVEEQLDVYDDYLDSQYQQGTLSYEDYKKWEQKLDEAEDKIDAAEDKLERTFGIKD
ncbi:MAG: hypothetical protein ACI4S2_07855 [Lachnospiraceae bacterium]